MFADYLLAAVFDCQMCRTSAIRGSSKRRGGVRSSIAALPRTEDIKQSDRPLVTRSALLQAVDRGSCSLGCSSASPQELDCDGQVHLKAEGKGLGLSAVVVVNRKSAIRVGTTENRSSNGLESVQLPDRPAGHPKLGDDIASPGTEPSANKATQRRRKPLEDREHVIASYGLKPAAPILALVLQPTTPARTTRTKHTLKRRADESAFQCHGRGLSEVDDLKMQGSDRFSPPYQPDLPPKEEEKVDSGRETGPDADC